MSDKLEMVRKGNSSKNDQNKEFCMFDDLAEELLLIILSYLSTRDRWSLSRTCQRFQTLYAEKQLWTKIDIPYEIESHETLSYILTSCINSRTEYLRIVGVSHGSRKGARNSLTPSLLLGAINEKAETTFSPGRKRTNEDDSDCENSPQSSKRRRLSSPVPSTSSSTSSEETDKCTALKELHLIRQRFDRRSLNLRDLPTTLRVLNLSGTHVSSVTEEIGYFRDISFYLVCLEELDMTDCTWITSHALLALSKLPSLLKLSLRGCRGIGNCIAYISLAMRLGFRKLKILDVTNTKFRGPDIDCASYLPCLEEFYVGEYDEFDHDLDYFSLSMDVNFDYFRQSSTMKAIDISGCVVTDNVFETFASMPRLSKIIAHFTDLTDDGIEEFRKLRPSCIIEKGLEFDEGIF